MIVGFLAMVFDSLPPHEFEIKIYSRSTEIQWDVSNSCNGSNESFFSYRDQMLLKRIFEWDLSRHFFRFVVRQGKFGKEADDLIV